MSRPVRVLICDGHDQLRDLVKTFLKNKPGIEVVGEAKTGKQAVYKSLLLHPDVVLMDLNMPELNGIEATRSIKLADESIRVLILTIYPQEELVGRCKEAGASGYVLKDMMNSLLIEAIHTLAQGKSYFIPTKPV
jgi:two-component system, NarL family, response regulator DegU